MLDRLEHSLLYPVSLLFYSVFSSMMLKKIIPFLFIFLIAWCIPLQKDSDQKLSRETIKHSWEEKGRIYSAWNNIAIHCEKWKLSQEQCKNFPKLGFSLKENNIPIQYGKVMNFSAIEFPWVQGTWAKISLQVLSWDIEVKIISLRHCSKQEIRNNTWGCSGRRNDKTAFIVIKSGEQKVLDMDEYRTLHSEAERQNNRVGFDVEIRPIGWEANFDYEISFKEDE